MPTNTNKTTTNNTNNRKTNSTTIIIKINSIFLALLPGAVLLLFFKLCLRFLLLLNVML